MGAQRGFLHRISVLITSAFAREDSTAVALQKLSFLLTLF